MISAARLHLHRDAPLGRHARRFIRFGMVGGSGVLVNNALLLALVERLRMPAIPAAIVATECAVVSNFVLNDRWTFRDVSRASGRPWPRRFVSYNVLTLGGLVIGVGVLALLHGVAGMHYLLANLVGIAMGTLWNYGTNHQWTWARRRAG
ncbi:MAG TPA: GtrA family protein [Candidatus Dormibacteraeota bacterium]|nr:GtrA family protein [Candidatus Dormibacteraeota bacterium]